jgi:hypothetical protein
MDDREAGPGEITETDILDYILDQVIPPLGPGEINVNALRARAERRGESLSFNKAKGMIERMVAQGLLVYVGKRI